MYIHIYRRHCDERIKDARLSALSFIAFRSAFLSFIIASILSSSSASLRPSPPPTHHRFRV